jgi:hypothetical protein
MTTKFQVTWTDFTVLKKHDIDRDKPYLWVFGIVVDAKSILDHKYVLRKPCTSDNLGQKFKKGDSVSVPSNLDISRDVSPFVGMATAGVVVIAWENAMTKDSVISDAYDKAADTIDDFVKDLVLAKFDELKSGKPLDQIDFSPTDEEIDDLKDDIEAKVRATIKAGWNITQLLVDHNIGSAQTLVTLGDPAECQCLTYRFISGSTDYMLGGDLLLGEPPPPPRSTGDPGTVQVKNQSPKPTSTVR